MKYPQPVWRYILFMAAIIIYLLIVTSCKAVKPERPYKSNKDVTEYKANPCEGGMPQTIRQAVFDDINVFNSGEQVPVNDQGVIDFEKGTRCFIIINHIRK
jgi:hypothetical protein